MAEFPTLSATTRTWAKAITRTRSENSLPNVVCSWVGSLSSPANPHSRTQMTDRPSSIAARIGA